MKTVGRILIILLAAAVIIGGTYALLQTSAGQALVGQPMGEGETGERPAPPDLADGTSALPSEAGERPAGGSEGSGGSWETVGRNLLQIVAIVAAAQVLWSIGRMIKRMAKKHHRLQLSRS